jgi:hypothetical protein
MEAMEVNIIPIKSFVHNFPPFILDHGDNTDILRKPGVQDSWQPSIRRSMKRLLLGLCYNKC